MTLDHYRRLLPYIPDIGPRWLQGLFASFAPHGGVRRMKNFIDRMHEESKRIYRAKLDALARGDEAVEKQVGEGRDVMSILSEAPSAGSQEGRC